MGSMLSSQSWTRMSSLCSMAIFTVYLPAAGLAYIVYSFGIKPFLSPLRKIPGLPYHPIFGNIREAIKGQAMEASIRWVTQYGGILRYYAMFGREFVLVADPEGLKQVFVTDQQKYGRPAPRNTPFGRSVLTVVGDEHRAHRLLLNPVFSPEIIKGHTSHFLQHAGSLVEHWKNLLMKAVNGHIAIQEDLYKMTFDIFGKTVFGQDFRCLEDSSFHIVHDFKALLSIDTVSMASALPFYRYLPTRQNRVRAKCKASVTAFINNLLDEKRKLLNGSQAFSVSEVKRDLLGCLLMARDQETGRGLTAQELLDEVVTLIFAGYETTAQTMSWILLTLAQQPEVQTKVRQEVTSVLSNTKGVTSDITWEMLESMKYLDCVIRECQRLYPAASTIPRYTLDDTKLGSYYIPKGTNITCHIGTMMRSPHVWENPERFDPERFRGENKPPMYAFLPFGTGPTKCLGHLFARTQMKAVLSQLISHFEFTTIPGREFKRKHRVILKAAPSIELAVKLID